MHILESDLPLRLTPHGVLPPETDRIQQIVNMQQGVFLGRRSELNRRNVLLKSTSENASNLVSLIQPKEGLPVEVIQSLGSGVAVIDIVDEVRYKQHISRLDLEADEVDELEDYEDESIAITEEEEVVEEVVVRKDVAENATSIMDDFKRRIEEAKAKRNAGRLQLDAPVQEEEATSDLVEFTESNFPATFELDLNTLKNLSPKKFKKLSKAAANGKVYANDAIGRRELLDLITSSEFEYKKYL